MKESSVAITKKILFPSSLDFSGTSGVKQVLHGGIPPRPESRLPGQGKYTSFVGSLVLSQIYIKEFMNNFIRLNILIVSRYVDRDIVMH